MIGRPTNKELTFYRQKMLREIEAERCSQDERWGGWGHGSKYDAHDWVAYIIRYVGRCIHWPFDYFYFRRSMVCVAALAVAAIEWVDRKSGRL